MNRKIVALWQAAPCPAALPASLTQFTATTASKAPLSIFGPRNAKPPWLFNILLTVSLMKAFPPAISNASNVGLALNYRLAGRSAFYPAANSALNA